eukprot:scaffold65605_cov33-Phaeocystis_antarctica.AAC.2
MPTPPAGTGTTYHHILPLLLVVTSNPNPNPNATSHPTLTLTLQAARGHLGVPDAARRRHLQ